MADPVRPARPQAPSDAAASSTTVQAVLDLVPGAMALLTPVRDDSGSIVDYLAEAASPEASDDLGRRGGQLVGVRVLEVCPMVVGSELWRAYAAVIADGEPREVGPLAYADGATGSTDPHYSVRVRRLGDRLLIAWIRHDAQWRLAERVARTERLGNLGWFERDLATGHSAWSAQAYRIMGVDPECGPPPISVVGEWVLPEDKPRWAQAVVDFIERGVALDVSYRVRINDTVRHVHSLGEAIRDGDGRAVRLFGLVQDVSGREEDRLRLAEAQRQLREHRRDLEAEHRLAVDLQQIILPVPDRPIDLPGLRLAVRYVPAEQVARIGGDWYQATPLPTGETILAIGDVAGHGLRAAAAMARLRHALGALIAVTTEPGELMGLLNRVLYDGGDGETATAVVCRYDPSRQTLTWAQAGHPAPLMARGGVPEALPRPHGLLLGAIRDAEYEVSTTPMGPDDMLLLYTDGLVERPGLPVAEGMTDVMAAVRAAIASAPDRPLSSVLARLHRANPDDDTCVLAARPMSAVSAVGVRHAG